MSDIGSERKPVTSDVGSEDEEQCIYLLEDCPLGKFIFIRDYLMCLLFCIGFLGFVILCANIFAIVQVCDSNQWSGKVIGLFKWVAPTVCIPVIFFIRYYVAFFWQNQAGISFNALVYLLKEVELQSSRDSAINWRLIACFTNELAWELQEAGPVFYGGEHCMKYFNKYVVGAVRNNSYEIETTSLDSTFGNEKAQRDLLDRSVESYQRIAEPSHKV